MQFSTSGCKQDCRNHDVERFRIKVFIDAKLVAAKAHHFDIEIVVNEFNFIAQLDKFIMLAQQAAQDLGKLQDQFARAVGIKAHQRRNRVQRVEQKMRIDLALQRVKTRFQKQALLLFQLHLNACEVPDLDWDRDGCHRGGNDRQQGHWTC